MIQNFAAGNTGYAALPLQAFRRYYVMAHYLKTFWCPPEQRRVSNAIEAKKLSKTCSICMVVNHSCLALKAALYPRLPVWVGIVSVGYRRGRALVALRLGRAR